MDEQTGEIAASARSRGVCRYLKVAMWHSDVWHAISHKGHSRLLYVYLLTGPHTLCYHVPGLYLVGLDALREALGLQRREFAKAVAELKEAVGIEVDVRKGLIWVPTAINHLGPPANPNIVRGYCKALASMPQSTLIDATIATYETFLFSLGRPFWQPLADRFPHLCRLQPAEDTNEQAHSLSRSAHTGATNSKVQGAPPEQRGDRTHALASIRDIFGRLSENNSGPPQQDV